MATKAATGKVNICNKALIHLKQKLISDIDTPEKGNTAENLCAEVYEDERRALLRKHPWNFAIRRAQIAASSTTPDFGFTHQFKLPSDFLRYLSRHQQNGTRITPTNPTEDYQIEDGFYLMSTEAPAILRIRYIYDHQDVPKWDSLFVKALAINIAVMIAPNFSGITNQTVARIKAEQKELVAEARAIDGQERPPIRVQHSRLARARRGGGNVASPFTIFDS